MVLKGFLLCSRTGLHQLPREAAPAPRALPGPDKAVPGAGLQGRRPDTQLRPGVPEAVRLGLRQLPVGGRARRHGLCEREDGAGRWESACHWALDGGDPAVLPAVDER